MRDTKPRIRQLPSGRWQVRAWNKDIKKYISLGAYPTEDEAKMTVLKFMAGVLDGAPERESAPLPSQRGKEKFGRFALEVCEAKKHKWEPSTYHQRVRDLNRHLIYFDKMPLSDVTYTQVVKWWSSMEDHPVSRKQAYQTLSCIMTRAVKLGKIPSSPCMIEGASKDYSKKRATFYPDDIRMLIMLADDTQMRAALHVLLGTGVRIGELLALDWKDVDFDTGKIDVHRHLTPYGLRDGTKHQPNGRRILIMPSEATEALVTLSKTVVPMPDQPVFLNAWKKRLTHKALYSRFMPLRAACALDNLNIHDIRHIHLTEYARHATLKEVMERAGHTDVSSSLRYQHTDEARQKNIVESLNL